MAATESEFFFVNGVDWIQQPLYKTVNYYLFDKDFQMNSTSTGCTSNYF